MGDTYINRVMEEQKTIRLIDRIYRSERINDEQFNQIWNLIDKRGSKSKHEQRFNKPIYKNDEWIDNKIETKFIDGKLYLGVFAYKEIDNTKVLMCYDVRPFGGRYIRIKYDKKDFPHLFWN